VLIFVTFAQTVLELKAWVDKNRHSYKKGRHRLILRLKKQVELPILALEVW